MQDRIIPDNQIRMTATVRSVLAAVSPPTAIALAASNAALSGLFVMMLWGVTDRTDLTIWLTMALIVSALDLALRLSVGRSSARSTQTVVFHHSIVLVDVAIGLLWLFAATQFFPAINQSLQFFYLFALVSQALCTAVYQHHFLVACCSRIGLALPVAAWMIYRETEVFSEVQSLIVLGVWVSVLWLAVRLNQGFNRRLALTESRKILLRQVAEHASELAALRTIEAESRQQAESANLAKSRFLAHSSHDLRQPLHAISLLLETVDDDQLDKSTGLVVMRVRQSVELLAKLFDSLLDLTLLDTGQVKISENIFDLNALLCEVASDFHAVAAANDVDIEVSAAEYFIVADPTVVRRIIQNLLANAIRHTAGGKVCIHVEYKSEGVFISVQDNGSGIALSDQKRIFEEFTKVEQSSTAHSQGSLGLGLAIVNRLAKLSGSHVSVESETGVGSRFVVGPFARSDSFELAKPANSVAVPDLNQIHVVVVDDDTDTLRATGKLLNKWGFNVTLRENDDLEGMAVPTLLVCDYDLGKKRTGIDVIKLSREKFGVRIPALLISGNTSIELAARAAEEDLRLLHKPVRPAQLKSAILTLLGAAQGGK